MTTPAATALAPGTTGPETAEPPSGRRARTVRTVLAVLGVVLVAVAIAIFVAAAPAGLETYDAGSALGGLLASGGASLA